MSTSGLRLAAGSGMGVGTEVGGVVGTGVGMDVGGGVGGIEGTAVGEGVAVGSRSLLQAARMTAARIRAAVKKIILFNLNPFN